MAYPDLTPVEFKTLKPSFADVPNDVVQAYIDLASVFIDQSWSKKLFYQAWAAYACHLMTLDGLGSSIEAQGVASGASQYQSVRSGELTLTRYSKAAGDTSYSGWLSQTSCGAFYWQLLRMLKAGPRIAIGSIAGGASPYAKDHLSGFEAQRQYRD